MSANLKRKLQNGVFPVETGKIIDVKDDPVPDPEPLPEPEPPQPLDQVVAVYLKGREPMGFVTTAKTALMVFQNILARQTKATETAPAQDIVHVIFDHARGTAVLLASDVQLITVHKQDIAPQPVVQAGPQFAPGTKPN